MNSLGSSLIWCGVQVSLLVLAGGMFYLLVRRRGPAAGSLAALGVLVTVLALSVLAMSPWPTWWRMHSPSVNIANVAGVVAATKPDTAQKFTQASEFGAATARKTAPTTAAATGKRASMPPVWAQAMWTNFWDALCNRPIAGGSAVWRWPAILAWLLLGGMALALGRLLFGLVALARCRRRTEPVTDAALAELLDATRARLDCRRRIELRESAEVASPAAVGWRRPLILLPSQWRSWSQLERRVVIAHEVAHVKRNDFLAALIAQFSVSLHFYNPLVRWIARRLRLEQEMAADAWGATLAGGISPYLTTLATMALRQDNPALIWAAQPFLPARRTLLRRIEMLRARKQPPSFTFSTPKQILVWTCLIALGLFVAGLRGPVGAISSAQAAPPDSKAAKSATHRDADSTDSESKPAKSARDGDSLDLESVPPVVVKTFPRSGDGHVDPSTTKIKVTFSKDMTDKSWSWSTATLDSFPETTGQAHYEDDDRTCVLPVKLEPGKTYGIWLNSNKFHNFRDSDGRPAVPYLLVFKTAKAD